MPTIWEGHYLDGRTAARQRATIQLMRTGLQATTERGATLWWPYPEIRQTQGAYAGEQVRLERGGEFPEALLVSDPSFLTALRQVAPELVPRFHDPARRRLRSVLTALAAIAAVGTAIVMFFWGLPSLAELAAARVPVSWEERLGAAVVEQLAPPEKRCADPERVRVIDDLLATVLAPLPTPPYTFQVIVVDDATVNAFATPGGYIVVLRGLLEQTRGPEELAGVLAHEIQHVLHRHPTRTLLQHASTGLLVTALTGDATGALGYAVESARTLGTLQYSRQNEAEADRDGMQMLLAAGISPAGMIAFLESLKKSEGTRPAVTKYFSTHPSTADRIEKLRALARQTPFRPVTLLPGYDWREIRKICRR